MPQIVEFPERPYLGIRKTITMTTFGVVGDRIAGMIGWLAERGVALTGAPFFRYDSIDMAADRLVVQVGVPIGVPVEPDGDMFTDVLPAGRFVTTTHHGHPDQLPGVIDTMLKWAEAQGLEWDMTRKDGTEHWGCRLELYPTNPLDAPDPNDWDIDLQFRLA
ncbi:GyrI-like domain-containing protein [Nonomuraea jiangxiensis]|uniref:Effector-binding domain-containing protein n=1 Tax=Nonomuraea jiangxiensis TaxID=633440 RepID=A0A1G8FQ95_9ACTN|nr:GyrI-like domain-containing protein [Nonomuraea jiangxiensis]SDH84348.1 effector-binding domain-containing protein [Nonomuraea jiangxiensis]